MPKPLIILENHLFAASRQFVTRYINELYEKGYRTLLLEMNSEVSMQSFRSQLQMVIMQSNSSMKKTCQAMLTMLDALVRKGISCSFIDPETQTTALQFNQRLRKAKNQFEYNEIMNARIEATVKRDAAMIETIETQAAIHNGGVIILSGFLHVELIKALSKSTKYDYRTVITFDSDVNESTIAQHSVPSPDNVKWLQLTNQPSSEALLTELYGTNDVPILDMSEKKSQSFNFVATQLALTNCKPKVDVPTIGEYFNQALDTTFEYTIDDEYVLTASTTLASKEVPQLTDTIRKQFPGLGFFKRYDAAHQERILIPGINLPENQEAISKGLIAAGVMRR